MSLNSKTVITVIWILASVSQCRCLSDEDIEEAFHIAYQRLHERFSLEERLVEEGRFVPRSSRKADLARSSGSSSGVAARKKEIAQLPFSLATDTLWHRFKLTPEEIAKNLPKRRLNGHFGRQAIASCHKEGKKPHCDPQYPYRTSDGTCNNLEHPSWGSKAECFQRLGGANYEGSEHFRKSVSGGPLPNPRLISLNVHSNLDVPSTNFNHLYMSFGQLLDHDVTSTPRSNTVHDHPVQCCPLRPPGETHPQCAPILISSRDPFYSHYGVRCMNFVRSGICKECKLGHRNHPNAVTSFIDASIVYGSDNTVMANLRTNSTGLLASQYTYEAGEVLPVSADPINDMCSLPGIKQYCFEVGDARGNQHPTLTALHILLHREHNRVARKLHRLNPDCSDEELFQEARKIVGAQMQVITYKEYLPITLSPKTMTHFKLNIKSRGTTKYNSCLNPTIAHEFSTAAFRFGHSLINSIMTRGWPNGGNQMLRDSFFEPFLLRMGYMDSLLGDQVCSPSQSFDRHVVPDVANFLYRNRGNGTGLDLASINIQRGRDHGLPPYAAMVSICTDGKIQLNCMDDLVANGLMTPENAALLDSQYSDVNDIDLWTGLLSEKHSRDSVVGPTAACIIGYQFQNLKFGDRFYFENSGEAGSFTHEQIEELRTTTLTKLLCWNTRISHLPRNAMLYPSETNPMIYCDSVRKMNLSLWKK